MDWSVDYVQRQLYKKFFDDQLLIPSQDYDMTEKEEENRFYSTWRWKEYYARVVEK